jgi:hypothetical protein
LLVGWRNKNETHGSGWSVAETEMESTEVVGLLPKQKLMVWRCIVGRRSKLVLRSKTEIP